MKEKFEAFTAESAMKEKFESLAAESAVTQHEFVAAFEVETSEDKVQTAFLRNFRLVEFIRDNWEKLVDMSGGTITTLFAFLRDNWDEVQACVDEAGDDWLEFSDKFIGLLKKYRDQSAA